MNKQKMLEKIYNNNKNVRFGDFTLIVEAFGFNQVRVSGSHHMYWRDGVNEMVNIQNVRGEVKPYQIKQFLSLIEMYNLKLED
jgi:predicted RNA binding protein YcfA (HicA-like mRNA interferase family)